MEAWKGKVAVVTGASAGIGAAICKDLCKQNIVVVGLARRCIRLNKLREAIIKSHNDAKFHPLVCDLNSEEDIKRAFDEIIDRFGGIDILVNNAGVGSALAILEEGSEVAVQKIMQTNLMAVVSCTKKAYKSMVKRDVPGYIINISSIIGHSIPVMGFGKPMYNAYPSSKYGLTAFSEVIRHELNYYKRNKIRISNISPGIVKTEIMQASGMTTEGLPEGTPMLMAEDVSDSVLYLLKTPPHVQIQDIIIKPTGEMI